MVDVGESRTYLQDRLTVLFKLMFWSFVALVAFLWLLYHQHPDIEPRHNRWVYAIAAGGLAAMAVMWRGVLVRRPGLSKQTLEALDLFYAIGSGACLGAAALICYDRPVSAYANLTYMCIAVLTRALIVPSTGTRTTLTSVAAFVPMSITAVVLPLLHRQEIPAPAFVVGFFTFAGVAVLLAAMGSRIIYGLRRQVSEAMQLGQYTRGRLIGKGGMGEVYLAHHALLRRPTAIKLLRPDRVTDDHLQRFVREVQLASQLTHPNTVAVYDYGHSADGTFYYAMEYLGGGIDLARLVREHGAQPSARVANILLQVCGALHEAHTLGISHRDIKPENIILCERGLVPDVAKVVDFGLAREVATETGVSTQLLLATPGYVAPEVITDAHATGAAPDLYALGAVGYFLVTGKPVFDGTITEVCAQHLGSDPRPPSELVALPRELESVLLRCLAKKPGDRYASAEALAAALRALPPDASWDAARARAWWRDHRGGEPDPRSSQSAMSLTIDLEREIEREAAP